MIDVSTDRQLCVSTDGNAGPYIMVPVVQLDKVRTVLSDNAISYWVDQEAISLDGKPEITVVNLGRDADPKIVQQHLDDAQ